MDSHTVINELQLLSPGVEFGNDEIVIANYAKTNYLAERPLAERLATGLQVLFNLSDQDEFDRIDRSLIDFYIAKLDQLIGTQLDEVLHDDQFQQLESLWKSLFYLVENTDTHSNCKIEILDVGLEELADDFQSNIDITQSGLYKHVYVSEFDTPGGEPFAAMVTPFEFTARAPDVNLLKQFAKVAAAAHCPLLASVGPKFFQKQSIDELNQIEDLDNYLQQAEYLVWNGFRQSEDARYVGLSFPRFLLRLPYGDEHACRSFIYHESFSDQQFDNYLWGSSSFALAANLVKSFRDYGWLVNIRGPESGGKVENLPLHQYQQSEGLLTRIPTETLISERRELELANLGFIPLSYYKNSDFACFFSANSAQQPAVYHNKQATANSRVNSRLPYIFLTSRIAHYLKVLQREQIGSQKSSTDLESELNQWLQGLVTKMNNPDPDIVAKHPLREGKVLVEMIEDNPGFYRVTLHAVPHFQIEGMDVRLSLVSKLPGESEA